MTTMLVRKEEGGGLGGYLAVVYQPPLCQAAAVGNSIQLRWDYGETFRGMALFMALQTTYSTRIHSK